MHARGVCGIIYVDLLSQKSPANPEGQEQVKEPPLDSHFPSLKHGDGSQGSIRAATFNMQSDDSYLLEWTQLFQAQQLLADK